MARTHAKIMTTIWQDEDFISLPAASQRMYLVLISQPKLSTCGALDYLPSRLARTAPDLTVESVEAAVADLERSRFVLVDRNTDELLIRTFVRNDGVCHRWQMVVAMWSAWENVLSRALRVAIVHEAPSAAWTTEKATPPVDALAMRSEPHWERDCQSDSDPEQLQPTTTPADVHLQPAVAPVATKSKPTPNQPSMALEVVAHAPTVRRDAAFEALCEVTATNPADLTPTGRGALNRALSEIRGCWKGTPEALADEMRVRATRYLVQMNAARITAPALAKHWATLTPESESLQSSKRRGQVADVLDAGTQAIIAKYAEAER